MNDQKTISPWLHYQIDWETELVAEALSAQQMVMCSNAGVMQCQYLSMSLIPLAAQSNHGEEED